MAYSVRSSLPHMAPPDDVSKDLIWHTPRDAVTQQAIDRMLDYMVAHQIALHMAEDNQILIVALRMAQGLHDILPDDYANDRDQIIQNITTWLTDYARETGAMRMETVLEPTPFTAFTGVRVTADELRVPYNHTDTPVATPLITNVRAQRLDLNLNMKGEISAGQPVANDASYDRPAFIQAAPAHDPLVLQALPIIADDQAPLTHRFDLDLLETLGAHIIDHPDMIAQIAQLTDQGTTISPAVQEHLAQTMTLLGTILANPDMPSLQVAAVLKTLTTALDHLVRQNVITAPTLNAVTAALHRTLPLQSFAVVAANLGPTFDHIQAPRPSTMSNVAPPAPAPTATIIPIAQSMRNEFAALQAIAALPMRPAPIAPQEAARIVVPIRALVSGYSPPVAAPVPTMASDASASRLAVTSAKATVPSQATPARATEARSSILLAPAAPPPQTTQSIAAPVAAPPLPTTVDRVITAPTAQNAVTDSVTLGRALHGVIASTGVPNTTAAPVTSAAPTPLTVVTGTIAAAPPASPAPSPASAPPLTSSVPSALPQTTTAQAAPLQAAASQAAMPQNATPVSAAPGPAPAPVTSTTSSISMAAVTGSVKNAPPSPEATKPTASAFTAPLAATSAEPKAGSGVQQTEQKSAIIDRATPIGGNDSLKRDSIVDRPLVMKGDITTPPDTKTTKTTLESKGQSETKGKNPSTKQPCDPDHCNCFNKESEAKRPATVPIPTKEQVVEIAREIAAFEELIKTHTRALPTHTNKNREEMKVDRPVIQFQKACEGDGCNDKNHNHNTNVTNDQSITTAKSEETADVSGAETAPPAAATNAEPKRRRVTKAPEPKQ